MITGSARRPPEAPASPSLLSREERLPCCPAIRRPASRTFIPSACARLRSRVPGTRVRAGATCALHALPEHPASLFAGATRPSEHPASPLASATRVPERSGSPLASATRVPERSGSPLASATRVPECSGSPLASATRVPECSGSPLASATRVPERSGSPLASATRVPECSGSPLATCNTPRGHSIAVVASCKSRPGVLGDPSCTRRVTRPRGVSASFRNRAAETPLGRACFARQLAI
jgi:hypothetical protein